MEGYSCHDMGYYNRTSIAMELPLGGDIIDRRSVLFPIQLGS